MDWSRGYTAKFYATYVDSKTWRDTDRFEIIGGTIQRENSNLLTSADIECKNYSGETERLIRVWLDTIQDGLGSHTPLFTGYTSSPERRIEGTRDLKTLQCYSTLLPASDVLLPRGWYAPSGIEGTQIIKSLLKVTNSPVEFSEKLSENANLTLTQAIIAEDNESNLTMLEKVLSAMNWRMWLDGYGRAHIASYDTEPVVTFGASINDVVEQSVTVEYDWFSCPNVLRVVMDDQVATAYDNDSDTPMSILNRGREVWYEETDAVLNDGETLQEYATRRLAELQRVSTTVNYNRRFDPSVYPLDVIGLNYPRQNLVGNFLVSSQTITLGFGAQTAEEVIAI